MISEIKSYFSTRRPCVDNTRAKPATAFTKKPRLTRFPVTRCDEQELFIKRVSRFNTRCHRNLPPWNPAQKRTLDRNPSTGNPTDRFHDRFENRNQLRIAQWAGRHSSSRVASRWTVEPERIRLISNGRGSTRTRGSRGQGSSYAWERKPRVKIRSRDHRSLWESDSVT